MQITVSNKRLVLSPLRWVITQGEQLAETVRFVLPSTYDSALSLTSLQWQIRGVSQRNTMATANLEGTEEGNYFILNWIVGKDFAAVCGLLSLALVGTSSDGSVVIKFPGDAPVHVKKSETGEYEPPPDAIENAINALQQAEAALQAAIDAIKYPIQISEGGTGKTTAPEALKALGGASAADLKTAQDMIDKLWQVVFPSDVAAHNIDPLTHNTMQVDGNTAKIQDDSTDLAQHIQNAKAHQNLIIDGNEKEG